MPFIHVNSLPFEGSFDVGAVVCELSREVAGRTGIELRHLTVTWRFLQSGHYAVAGRTASLQPDGSHPLLVEFLTPDFYTEPEAGRALTAIAESLAKLTGISGDNIFIQHRTTRKGRVYDQGRVLSW